MKFDVHIFTQVRVKVAGVEAADTTEAMLKAGEMVDFQFLLRNSNPDADNVEYVEWAEGAPDIYLIDPLLPDGEVDYEESLWLGPDGSMLVDGLTTDEQNARAFVALEPVALKLAEATLEFIGRPMDLTNAPCHKGLTTPEKCGRCGREMALREAASRILTLLGGVANEQ